MSRLVCVLTFLALTIALSAADQSVKKAEAPKPKKQSYLIRLTPLRAGFVDNPTAAEQKLMTEHFVRLQKIAATGKILLAGPSINGPDTFGIVVVEVESKDEAMEIMQGDPSVKAGLMKGEVLPFNVAIAPGR